uniref:Uncharacterized protein n=1 Tax=Arion vulgaris TaxID=1028688 RepID=A0A0B7BX27_9EUPU
MLLRFEQNPKLMELLKQSKDKLLLNVFDADPYEACGADANTVNQFLLENCGKTVEVPMGENPTNLQEFPTICSGKNIQGIMIMLARHELLSGN